MRRDDVGEPLIPTIRVHAWFCEGDHLRRTALSLACDLPGGGALNPMAQGTDTLQQAFLATPQHA